MSWKKISLRRKPSNNPSLPIPRQQSLKKGDNKRIWLMNMVKEGKLTSDTAMRKAYAMGITSMPSYEEMNDDDIRDKNGQVMNFGVYKYGRNNKSVKRILQIDCQKYMVCLLHHGVKQQVYRFETVAGVDTTDGSTRVVIQFDDGADVEVDAGNFGEKNRIMRTLNWIVGQMNKGLPLCADDLQLHCKKIFVEGVLEKKGHSAASLVWSKRYVRVSLGEIVYFKVGEQHDDSLALSIVPIRHGECFLRKQDEVGFIITSKTKEYSFRLCSTKNVDTEKERDVWLLAIQDAMMAITTTSDPAQSERPDVYLKSIVGSLNSELEQLGAILNIIDAPIRASTQVKKVREIVCSLNEQIRMGLLSWTLRNAVPSEEVQASHAVTREYSIPETVVTSREKTGIPEYAVVNKSKTQQRNTYCNTERNRYYDAVAVGDISQVTEGRELSTLCEDEKKAEIKGEENGGTLRREEPINGGFIPSTPDAFIPPPPPPPPPPPIIGQKQSLLKPKPDVLPTQKMKPLFWSKVPDVHISTSFWKDAQDRVVDTEKLEKLFCAGQQNANKVEKEMKPSEISRQLVTLLGQRKAQNLGIFLSGFKMNVANISAKLSNLNSESLSAEELVALRRFHPTTDEIEMYKSYKGDVEMLSGVDKFMLGLCDIPKLSKRLDMLLTLQELPDEIKFVQEPIENVLAICRCLFDSEDFCRLLEYVLAIGNYMNGGTSRGTANGFKLGVLGKLVDVRSSHMKVTLLEFIVDELWLVDRAAITCYTNMSAMLAPVPEISLQGLIAEVQVMKRDVEGLIQTAAALGEVISDDLKQYVSEFVTDNVAKISTLEGRCREVENLSQRLKEKFGESVSVDFEMWLVSVSDFVKQLQRAVENAEEKEHRVSVSMNATTKSDASMESQGEIKHAEREEAVMDESKHKTDANIDNTSVRIEHPEYNEDMSFPTKCGYLEKLSGGKKRTAKWDRRYFELTNAGYLQYSKNERGKLAGAVYLRGCPVDIDPQNNIVFTVRQEDRCWTFRADNALEAMDWVHALLYYAKQNPFA